MLGILVFSSSETDFELVEFLTTGLASVLIFSGSGSFLISFIGALISAGFLATAVFASSSLRLAFASDLNFCCSLYLWTVFFSLDNKLKIIVFILFDAESKNEPIRSNTLVQLKLNAKAKDGIKKRIKKIKDPICPKMLDKDIKIKLPIYPPADNSGKLLPSK